MEVGSRYTYVDGSVLVAVPAVHSSWDLNFSDSREHEVTLSDFWIYSNEVTNRNMRFASMPASVPRLTRRIIPHTVFTDMSIFLLWRESHQAASYCEFVHGRLPTEAEWEKAARGPESNLFPWEMRIRVATCSTMTSVWGKLVNVLSYPDGVSFYGLFDMSGNVREWVADWYIPEYDTSAAASKDPLGPTLGDKRSVRSSGLKTVEISPFCTPIIPEAGK